MEAGKRNISDIFNRWRTLEIPFFQRSYVWREENWQRFLDDMRRVNEQRQAYFMGSIILKQLPTDSGESIGDRRSVIDGQQRLTTMTLFFRVLADVLGQESLFREVFHNASGDLCLQHNHNDIEIFEAIARSNVTSGLQRKYRKSGVLKAYEFFLDNRELMLEDPALVPKAPTQPGPAPALRPTETEKE